MAASLDLVQLRKLYHASINAEQADPTHSDSDMATTAWKAAKQLLDSAKARSSMDISALGVQIKDNAADLVTKVWALLQRPGAGLTRGETPSGAISGRR